MNETTVDHLARHPDPQAKAKALSEIQGAKSYPDAATIYEEVDIDEVDLRTHKWLSARYDAAEWAALRGKRDELLAASDWVVVKAQEAGEAVPSAWQAYRVALRDLPANTADPASPVWPSAP